MKISKEYLSDFINRKVIPITAWTQRYRDGKLCFEIKNEIYCKVFWLDFWYNEIAPKFKSQNMISYIENVQLDTPIIITESYNFLNVPPIIKNVDYYSKPRTDHTKFKINISLTFAFTLSILIFCLILIPTIIWGSKSNYTMLV